MEGGRQLVEKLCAEHKSPHETLRFGASESCTEVGLFESSLHAGVKLTDQQFEKQNMISVVIIQNFDRIRIRVFEFGNRDLQLIQ